MKMIEVALSNSIVSLNAKKNVAKLTDKKTSSTCVDSSSQKSESPKYKNYLSRKKNIKRNNFYQSINELKQFKSWNSSNLNAMYQSILTNDSENYLNIKPKFNNQTDVTAIHRTILVDWLINVHLYFKLSDECLFLSIKIIDTFLARIKNFTKNKIQLLGICSLQISSKFIEPVHPSIKDLTELCDFCYTKEEIIKFEKYLLQVNDYIIEQDQALNYYDLLSLVFKFNIKQYYFGKMLLDMTLLDTNFYNYQKNTMVFSVCYLVINNPFMIENDCIELNNKIYIKQYQEKNVLNDELIYRKNIEIINKENFLFSLYPKKDYSLIFKCGKEIVDLYENIKTSKYNTAIQKYSIQLKELIEDSLPPEQQESMNDEEDKDMDMIIVK